MPDRRKHRGPHPEDHRLFAPERLSLLREAAFDLTWLLNRGYARETAQQIVGDRYQLHARQRTALGRSVCSDAQRDDRKARELAPDALRGRELWIDGYNVLTSVEAALGGGVLLLGRDDCLRDLASMHGSFRKVEETRPAAECIARTLRALQPARVHWLLDRPVSNSGRLKTILETVGAGAWSVELADQVDRRLAECGWIVATADSGILERCGKWLTLAKIVVERSAPEAWIVQLAE